LTHTETRITESAIAQNFKKPTTTLKIFNFYSPKSLLVKMLLQPYR
jgi:hypothetical protein